MNELMDKIKPLMAEQLITLEIFVTISHDYGIHFRHCNVKDGIFLKGVSGYGKTIEEALADYIGKISGKTLVFGSGDNREEIIVLI